MGKKSSKFKCGFNELLIYQQYIAILRVNNLSEVDKNNKNQ